MIIIILPTPTAQQQTQSLHRPSTCTVCTHQDSSQCNASKRVVKMIKNAASVYRMISTATHHSHHWRQQGILTSYKDLWAIVWRLGPVLLSGKTLKLLGSTWRSAVRRLHSHKTGQRSILQLFLQLQPHHQ